MDSFIYNRTRTLVRHLLNMRDASGGLNYLDEGSVGEVHDILHHLRMNLELDIRDQMQRVENELDFPGSVLEPGLIGVLDTLQGIMDEFRAAYLDD